MSFVILCLIVAVINGVSNICFSIKHQFQDDKLYINLILSWIGFTFAASLPVYLIVN
ncbi:MAG: hypothetical protein Unbinned6284contig1004_48 [Prokaryotic dsDNA virus sp.]|nr:MAG: hypothetical protein Unbinned6284contig1004_48 [Prokaryotic dsDNA virus sp.]|tara:strand:+ start:7788 stop:7958 length:171 start_codon:yes stop_codon:yes gene_type:complete